MTDLRITFSSGKRIEVSNTYLTASTLQEHNPLNPLTGEPGLLFSRSQAPSKREVRTASGRASRKAHNARRPLQRASNPPTAPSPNITLPKPAGGIHDHEHTCTTHLEHKSTTPFDQNNPLLDLYKR